MHEVEMETERGSFSRHSMSDELGYESKGEKWEQTEEIVED